jgi:integrase
MATKGDKLWDDEVKGFHILKITTGCSFRVFYRTHSGKQRVTTLGRYGSITADQARKLAKEVTGKVAAGEDVSENKAQARQQEKHLTTQTLGAFIDGPYKTYQCRKKSGDATIAMLTKHFGDWWLKPMPSISSGDVERWHLAMESKKLQYETINRIFGALKTCLNKAIKLETISGHKLKGLQLERPKLTENMLATPPPSRRYLTNSETMKFFQGLDLYQESKRHQRRNSRSHGQQHLPNLDDVEFVDHVKPWLLTMYYSGLRPGDIFGLRWEHVDLTFNNITKIIEKTAHHSNEMWSFPMSEALTLVLKRWHQQCGKPFKGYVFTSRRTQTRMNNTSMQTPWKAVKVLAGIDNNLQIYSLRHNFGSQLMLNGADLLTVSKLMAHTNIQTTIKHYGHLNQGQARNYLDQFANRDLVLNEETSITG